MPITHKIEILFKNVLMLGFKECNKTIFIFLFVVFSACTVIIPDDTKNKSYNSEKSTPKVAMIILHLANNNGLFTTSISDAKIIETDKKIDNKKLITWNENDFLCFILDGQNKIMDTMLIVQPLHPRFEYPEEDNTIGSKVIEQKQNDVMLKFSYAPPMKYLQCAKVEKSHQLKFLDIIEIPFSQ